MLCKVIALDLCFLGTGCFIQCRVLISTVRVGEHACVRVRVCVCVRDWRSVEGRGTRGWCFSSVCVLYHTPPHHRNATGLQLKPPHTVSLSDTQTSRNEHSCSRTPSGSFTTIPLGSLFARRGLLSASKGPSVCTTQVGDTHDRPWTLFEHNIMLGPCMCNRTFNQVFAWIKMMQRPYNNYIITIM